jgi:hypothetical protein
MEKETKSKILSIVLISLLSVVIIIFVISIVFRFIIGPPADPNIDDNIKKLSVEEVIQVNVLNGCGVSGLASKARDYLRSKGFDVVDIGNYDKDTDKTFIIDRLNDRSSAKKVAYALGVADSLIITNIDSTLFLRCSIILGHDYKILRPFK